MNNSFLRSKEICPNLPDGVHKIAKLVAKRMEKDYIPPQELALIFTTILEEETIENFDLFPQLVDELQSDRYATEFRKVCQEVIGIDPPIITRTLEYPENVDVATDWWVKAVLFRDTSNMSVSFKKYFQKRYTTEEIAIFKSTLARNIMKELDTEGEVWLGSEWTAEGILEIAGNKIGVNPLFGYPNASMMVYKNEVKVCDGIHWQTIFCNYNS